MTPRRGIAALVFALTLLLANAPAYTQYTVFISGSGSDANNCTTPATACRTFTHALATVQTGGVILVLPGEYSGVTITKSVDIIADEGQVSMTSSAPFSSGIGATILVNAGPTDVIRVRGIATSFPTLPASGVGVLGAGAVYVENCSFLNGSGAFGLVFRPSGNSSLVVSNSKIAGNSGGIEIRPGAGAIADVTIENTQILNNSGHGIDAINRANVLVRNSTIVGNDVGVRAAGPTALVRIANSTIRKNQTGLDAVHGQIVSHHQNVLSDNVNDGAFTSSVNQQ